MKTALIVWGLLVATVPPSPTIQPNSTTSPTTFLVAFERGAASACTVYRSRTETITQDGKTVPYAPRHCWLLAPDLSTYTDDWAYISPDKGDWDIFAEVYYDRPKGTETRTTNLLRVRR